MGQSAGHPIERRTNRGKPAGSNRPNSLQRPSGSACVEIA